MTELSIQDEEALSPMGDYHGTDAVGDVPLPGSKAQVTPNNDPVSGAPGEPEVRSFPVNAIQVGRRVRFVDPEQVDELAKSIQKLGLRTPITVRVARDVPVLVTGLHRLEAVKRLNHETIACFIEVGSELDAKLWEIDENLCRAELSELEQGEHLLLRKEIYQELYPETKQGGLPGAPGGGKAKTAKLAGFAANTAARTNIAERTVRRSIRRASKIDEMVRDRIRDKPEIANSGVELDALAGLPPGDQQQAIDMVEASEAATVRLAKKLLKAKVRQPSGESPEPDGTSAESAQAARSQPQKPKEDPEQAREKSAAASAVDLLAECLGGKFPEFVMLFNMAGAGGFFDEAVRQKYAQVKRESEVASEAVSSLPAKRQPSDPAEPPMKNNGGIECTPQLRGAGSIEAVAPTETSSPGPESEPRDPSIAPSTGPSSPPGTEDVGESDEDPPQQVPGEGEKHNEQQGLHKTARDDAEQKTGADEPAPGPNEMPPEPPVAPSDSTAPAMDGVSIQKEVAAPDANLKPTENPVSETTSNSAEAPENAGQEGGPPANAAACGPDLIAVFEQLLVNTKTWAQGWVLAGALAEDTSRENPRTRECRDAFINTYRAATPDQQAALREYVETLPPLREPDEEPDDTLSAASSANTASTALLPRHRTRSQEARLVASH
jgi:hypothetical protein